FFLDCLSLSFWWQQKNDLANFSKKWLQNYEKTLQWLKAMVEPTTGQAPNLGHNDGGQIIAFSDCSFSDYRPSLTLAHSLLYGKHPYSEGPWEEPLTLLAIETQTNTSDFNFYQTQEFPIGGIVK